MTDERECLDVENETYATLADFIDRPACRMRDVGDNSACGII